MDKKDIESAAISEIKDSIMNCDILSPYISENDKEPSWDGFIYIYKNKDKKKKNIQGRVAVQVKGELNSNFSSTEIKHRAEITDLRNYQRDNGVIYFVVYINKENTRIRKVYFETLTPVKLATLYLKSNENKSYKNIKLRAFPENPENQKIIFLNFLEDSRKQVSYPPENIVSFEELERSNISGFTYLPKNQIPYKNLQTLLNVLSENEIYFYVSDKDNKNLVPTNFFTSPNMKMGIMDTVDSPISINDKIYYNNFKRIFSKDSLIIHIGHSISITINEQKDTKLNFKLISSVRKGVIDLFFFTEVLKNKNKFSIDKKEINFSISAGDLTEEQYLAAFEEKLILYNKVIKLFNTLHIDSDLDIDSMSRKDELFLEILFKAILDKEAVDIVVQKNSTIANLKIANLLIKLVAFKKDNNELYTLQDFFNSELQAIQKNDNDDIRLTCIFSILNKEDYLSASNIDYDAIFNSYKSLAGYDYIYEMATNDMLKMLSAYDTKPNPKLFELIKRLSDWLLNESGNNISHEIALLNKYQIIKRERNFEEDEINKLIELSENTDLQYKVAANILLGHKETANVYLKKLPFEDQELFKTFPIYKFFEE